MSYYAFLKSKDFCPANYLRSVTLTLINALNFKVYRLKYSRNALHINVLPFARYFKQRSAPFIRHRRRSQGYQSFWLQNQNE